MPLKITFTCVCECVCVCCVCECVLCVCFYFHAHPTLHVGSITLESQFSFHPVGLRDQTQIARLGGKLLYLPFEPFFWSLLVWVPVLGMEPRTLRSLRRLSVTARHPQPCHLLCGLFVYFIWETLFCLFQTGSQFSAG